MFYVCVPSEIGPRGKTRAQRNTLKPSPTRLCIPFCSDPIPGKSDPCCPNFQCFPSVGAVRDSRFKLPLVYPMNLSGRAIRIPSRSGITGEPPSFAQPSLSPIPASPSISGQILPPPQPSDASETVVASIRHLDNTPNPHSEHSDQLDQSHQHPVDPISRNDGPNVGTPLSSLAHSLRLLAEKVDKIPSYPSSRSVKPRSPDIFDGSDPAKLETFIFQISMYISARSKDFPDSKSQVTFALSYLEGTSLEWFQAELYDALSGQAPFPTWFTSFPTFLSELRRIFGPPDPTHDAITALEFLRYKDTSKATRYTLDFNRHAYRTGWNDQALSRCYYKGLPDRLKDEIARVGKPSNLLALQDLASTLDQRYWERQLELNNPPYSSQVPSDTPLSSPTVSPVFLSPAASPTTSDNSSENDADSSHHSHSSPAHSRSSSHNSCSSLSNSCADSPTPSSHSPYPASIASDASDASEISAASFASGSSGNASAGQADDISLVSNP